MAKKKKVKTDKDVAQLQKDIKAGLGVDKSLLGPGGALTTGNGFLGRVSENVDTAALDRSAANAAGAGINTADQNAALENLKRIAESAGIRSSDIQALIDQRRSNMTSAGQTSPEMQALATEAQRRYDTSQQIDPLVQEAIDRQRSGLGGYDSAESQAYMENLTGQASKAVSGGLRAASGGIAASGLRGGFGNAARGDILKDYSRAQMEARNQLTAANANLVDSRLGAFTNLAQNTSQNLYDRGNQTFSNLTDLKSFLDQQAYNRKTAAENAFETSVTGAETNEFNRRLSAGQTYDTGVEANVINNRADVDNKMAAYRAELGRVSDDSLRRSMTNINTLAAEISARTGLVLGVPQHLTAVRNSRAANELAAQQIEAMKGMSAGGEESSGSGSGTGVADPDLKPKTPVEPDNPQPNSSARQPLFTSNADRGA